MQHQLFTNRFSFFLIYELLSTVCFTESLKYRGREFKDLLHKLSRESFLNSFFAKLSFLICDSTRFCARRSNQEFLQVNRVGTGTIQSEDFRRHPAFRRVLFQSVCKVSFPPWFTCKLLVQVSIPMVNIYSLSTANNIANHLQWTTMWSWRLSEINVGYLWIGRLKLVKITFVYSYFLVKKNVVCGGKLLVLFDARKTGFITTLFYALLQCATKLCSQRPFDICFSQIVERRISNCRITCVIWAWIKNIKITRYVKRC